MSETVIAPRKAYVVSCPDDDHGSEVVFAGNANEARRNASQETCDCGYINRTARRDKRLDQYAATGVTLKMLVEMPDSTWRVPCAECERQCFGDEQLIWTDGDERAFCSDACLNKFKAFWKDHVNCPTWLHMQVT